MDHSHGGTTPLHRDLDPPRECRACAITQSVFRRNSGHVAEPGAEHVNSEVVVFRGPSIGGVVVVPRAHINGLEELTVLRRAKVLAALRRAARWVRDTSPGSAPSVVAVADPLAPERHVCFRVVADGTPFEQQRADKSDDG